MANRLQNALIAFGVLLLLLGLTSQMKPALEQDRKKSVERMEQARSKEVERCQRLQQVFDKFDGDKDGMLFQEELRNLALGGELTGTDVEDADFLYSRCQQIGHSVGTHRSGKFTYSVYAISKLDLKRYAETKRMEERLKREFPYGYHPPKE